MLRAWLPAICGMVCLGLGAGLIGVYGFFVDDLSQEFGVGAATINIGPIALLLVPGVVAPFAGKLVDRVSPRKIMLAGSTLAMASLIAVSQAPSLLIAGLGFLGFSLGMAFYGPVVVNGLLVKIYPGTEARALAIAAIGISVATASLPPIVGLLLDSLDWRQTLMILAACILCILWLAILLGIPAQAQTAVVQAGDEPSVKLTHEKVFWQVGICVALGFNVAIVLAICYPAHFIAQGFSIAQAGWFISLAGVGGLCGKSLLALVADRLQQHAKWMAAVILSVQGLGLLLLPAVTSVAQAVPVIFMLGFTGGAFLPMHSYLNSRYFDAGIIGQVTGAQMPLFLPLGIIGPPLAGYLYDQQGNYHQVMTGLGVVLFLAAAVAISLPLVRQSNR